MRPTVTEQLDGVCRILETTIAPELGHGYTLETLRSLIANIRMLSRSWERLLPFLQWDNAATSALLLAARVEVDAALGSRIDTALAQAPAESTDGIAADSFNTALRGLLAECVDLSPALHERVVAHLAERAVRYPLRLTGAVPKHQS